MKTFSTDDVVNVAKNSVVFLLSAPSRNLSEGNAAEGNAPGNAADSENPSLEGLSFEFARQKVNEEFFSRPESLKKQAKKNEQCGQLSDYTTMQLLRETTAWKQQTTTTWINCLTDAATKYDVINEAQKQLLCPQSILDALREVLTPSLLSGLNVLFAAISTNDIKQQIVPPPQLDVTHSVIATGIFCPSSRMAQSHCAVPLFDLRREMPQCSSNPIWQPSVVDGRLISLDSRLEEQTTRFLLPSEEFEVSGARPLAVFNVVSHQVEKPPQSNVLELDFNPLQGIEQLEMALTQSKDMELDILKLVKEVWGYCDPPETISVAAFTIPIDLIPALNFDSFYFQ